MEVTYQFKHLTKEDEKKFVDYVEQKIPAIANLLTKFADDAAILKASIEKFEKHDAYEVEFQLSLPAKSLVAKEASHQIMKAVDLSKDRLQIQIKKHIAHLRKDRQHGSIRHQETELKVSLETY
jgi:ribosome-associated translation inhibitor RaiA